MTPEVAIIVVQYSGWQHTAACLESLSRLEYPAFRVLVVDNGSPDSPADELEIWVRMSALNYARQTADCPLSDQYLTILTLPKNHGYAGGNNVGLRLLLDQTSVRYFWLLNNDTLVEPDALRHLVERLESEPAAGLAGSTLLFAGQGQIVQALGGGYFIPWFGYSKLLAEGQARETIQTSTKEVEKSLDFLLGASCLVRRDFLEQVGLMDESLFLYFEELDWALRGRNFEFMLAYAPQSVVYHHGGASTGATGMAKSALADYYFHRNRLVLVRRYFPLCMATAYASLGVTLLRRIWRGQWSRLPLILKAGWDALWLRKTA